MKDRRRPPTEPAGNPRGRRRRLRLGQTASVTSGRQKSSYTYDADGDLLMQADPGSTTVYLDGGAEQLSYATATKKVSGLRFYATPDGTIVVRSSAGTISYEVTSQQHTAVDAINASTLAVTRRYFDPYGNPAGTAPSSWPDSDAYLGKPGTRTRAWICWGRASTTR
jgi:YD repeat-containing protein